MEVHQRFAAIFANYYDQAMWIYVNVDDIIAVVIPL